MSQSEFVAGLLNPEAPAPDDLVGPTGAPAGKRYDVYRNNVTVSLGDALQTAFPVILKLVGAEFFKAMAAIYVRAHPPQSPLMMFYGAEMPAFLADFPPVAHLPYLPDVARVELAVRHAYHAADARPFTGDDLGGISEGDLPGLRFTPSPAAQLIESAYPVASIWRANMMGGENGTGAEAALIARPGFDPQVDVVTGPDIAVARALLAGQTLAHAAEAGDPGPMLTLLLTREAFANEGQDT